MRNSIWRRIWSLLTPAQRRGALALLVMMVLGTALETLGIGLVIPLLALMSQADPVGAHPQLARYLGGLARLSHEELVLAAMLALVLIYAIKTIYLAWLNWSEARYVFALQQYFSQQLFDCYLRQPYVFHLQRNSAQMIRNVVNETSQFSHVVTIPALLLLSEGFVLLGIGCLLLYMATLGALIVIVTVGFASFAFQRVMRSRLLRWGDARQLHDGMRIQHLQQGLGGIKEVKVLGREAQFLARYAVHNRGASQVGQRQLTLQNVPRLWLELLGVVGLAALVLTMLSQGKPLAALVPTLGLFAAAAFRLMPSINKVLMAVQNLRFAEPVVNTLIAELSLEREPSAADPNSPPLTLRRSLDLEDLTFAYPGSPEASLRNISLSIPAGSSIGFVGGSGAGKTTLIDIVLGILNPTTGRVRVDGLDVRQNLRSWQNQLGYVPQHIYLGDDSLRENVAFGVARDKIDDTAVWRALAAAQLDDFVKELPDGLDSVVGERGVRLSGGQRQRIGIARALYHDPSVLVLDEATSALDTATEQGVMRSVRALHGRKTVLLVAHRTSTVEHCDLIVRLARGEIEAMGDPSTILRALDEPVRPYENART